MKNNYKINDGNESFKDEDDDNSKIGTSTTYSRVSNHSGIDSVCSPSICSNSIADTNSNSADKEHPSSPIYVPAKVANEEQKLVKKSRMLVVIIISAVTVLLGYYGTASQRNKESNNFKSDFDNMADLIIEVSRSNIKNTFDSIEVFASMVSTIADNTNQRWPYVTIPNFAELASKQKSLSKAKSINLAVLVNPVQQRMWEKFSYLDMPIMYQDFVDFYHLNTTSTFLRDRSVPYIWTNNDDDDNDGNTKSAPSRVVYNKNNDNPMLIAWQTSPTDPSYFLNDSLDTNTNILYAQNEENIIDASHDSHEFLTVHDDSHDNSHDDSNDSHGQDSHDESHDGSRDSPDGFHDSHDDHDKLEDFRNAFYAMQKTLVPSVGLLHDSNQDGLHSQKILFPILGSKIENTDVMFLAATIWIEIDWEDYFINLMKSGEVKRFMQDNIIPAIDAVIVDECMHRSLTYRIVGKEAQFIGSGNLRDKNYDHMVIGDTIYGYYDNDNGNDDSNDSSRGGDNNNNNNEKIKILDSDLCIPELTIYLYPTKSFEESYRDSLFVVLVFSRLLILMGAICLVFFVYDRMVRMQQRKVMERVLRQDKIVSNMLPANIRDRLLQIDTEAENRNKNNGNHTNSNEIGAINMNIERADKHNKSGESLSEGSTGSNGDDYFGMFGSKPLAELYPSATIVFVDLSGFTKWSSTREPPQVFELLENIFRTWDKLAYRHGVFKIETVGDCYVAVAGLPDKREDHVVAIAKFARDVVAEMGAQLRKLEMSLGPDTTHLSVRIGIHSGKVTAGLLRGDKSRYQLFGDTVNFASRMQSTSKIGCIQASEASAQLLQEYGKSKWVKRRLDPIEIKGKAGLYNAYWIKPKSSARPTKSSPSLVARSATTQKSSRGAKVGDSDRTGSMHTINEIETSPSNKVNDFYDDKYIEEDNDIEQERREEEDTLDDSHSSFLDLDETVHDSLAEFENSNDLTKSERLVRWNVSILGDLLRQILAARVDNNDRDNRVARIVEAEKDIMMNGNGGGRASLVVPTAAKAASIDSSVQEQTGGTKRKMTVLEEFEEIIYLPQIGVEDFKKRKNPNLVQLPDKVEKQLQEFLTGIASMYRENYFHNFEHAAHVTASVRKLLSSIVRVDNSVVRGENDLKEFVTHSYGITSDPLTQFAVVLSAIIHDVDHPGVPNTQLVKEKTAESQYYKNKSVAEQRSVDLSWKLLMASKFSDLRACIYTTEEELRRFRQLVVNVVMATDIVDKELSAQRKARWAVAFSEEENSNSNAEEFKDQDDVVNGGEDQQSSLVINRKATIVLEHLIQASDVCHMMQHFEVYRDWNEHFFFELYAAYEAGRANEDPTDGWYNGEIGFYDFYVIPLAKKLDKCGVFGVSSHEYYDYATSNRNEWVSRGHEIVQEYVQKYEVYKQQKQEKQQHQ